MRIRLVVADDTPVKAKMLEQSLADYYPIIKLEKRSTTLWYLSLLAYEWTGKDADFMNSLLEGRDLLAAWRKFDD